MKRREIKIMGVLIFILSLYAEANSSFGPVTIEKIAISDFDFISIRISTDGTSEHTENCDESRKYNLILDKDSPYHKEMYSLALSAFMSGTKIRGWANGCHTYGNNYSSPKLTVITVEK